MENSVNRAIAILNAIIGGVATQEQRQQALAAYTVGSENETTEQIAARMVQDVEHFLINRMHSFESKASKKRLRDTFVSQL